MAYTKRQKKIIDSANWLDNISDRLNIKRDTDDLRRRVRRIEMKKGKTR